MEIPKVKLDSGVTVANFCSGHPIIFITGEKLDACEAGRVRFLRMETTETKRSGPDGRWLDLYTIYDISPEIFTELDRLKTEEPDVDIILVPLPMMQALKEVGRWDEYPKLRVIKWAHRETQLCSADRFGR